jgi:hypothetical protein
MQLRSLAVLFLSTPLLAQASWSTASIAPADHVHRPSVAIGDVDGDRIDDLLLGRNGVIVVRRGTRGAPERQFEERERPLPSRVRHMPEPVAVGPSCESAGQPRLADIDRDGDLDVVAIDAELGGGGRVVWFANDGRGTFAEPQAVGGERPLQVRGDLRAVDLADVDRDGHLDLLIATDAPRLHRGSATGFAADGSELGVRTRGTSVLADWDGDTMVDLVYVDGGAVLLRRATRDGYAQPERLCDLEQPDMAQLAVADWDGDGRLDLLLGETLPQPAPAVEPAGAAEAKARRLAAQRVLDVVAEEIGRLNAVRPPTDDAAAMAARNAWREELGRWAAGPRALLDAPRQKAGSPGGRLRALLRR